MVSVFSGRHRWLGRYRCPADTIAGLVERDLVACRLGWGPWPPGGIPWLFLRPSSGSQMRVSVYRQVQVLAFGLAPVGSLSGTRSPR